MTTFLHLIPSIPLLKYCYVTSLVSSISHFIIRRSPSVSLQYCCISIWWYAVEHWRDIKTLPLCVKVKYVSTRQWLKWALNALVSWVLSCAENVCPDFFPTSANQFGIATRGSNYRRKRSNYWRKGICLTQTFLGSKNEWNGVNTFFLSADCLYR